MSDTAHLSFATRQMMRMRGLEELTLTVDAVADISPHMRRVAFTSPALSTLQAKPGQDLVLMLPDGDGEPARRHYTIRKLDGAGRTLHVDFVLHGDASVAMRWLAQARTGDRIVAFGPRGRNVLHEGADWRLFVADETGLPAVAGMIEALPKDAVANAFVEVFEEIDRQSIISEARVDMVWTPRGGPPRPPSSLLIDAVAAWSKPAGAGHVYLLAETSTVRAIRHALLDRGFAKSAIFAEGYWRPGRVGGHDHV